MTEPSKRERDRLERVHRAYSADPRMRERWDPSRAGNQLIDAERWQVVAQLLADAGLSPVSYPVVDVGCGSGDTLARLGSQASAEGTLIGLDVVPSRIFEAARRRSRLLWVVGDARALPFATASVRLATVSTVFSSILDDAIARRVADEIDRVLVPSGTVLWYDYRVSHPRNPNTRGIRRTTIASLFTGYRVVLRPVTLVPPVARVLGPMGALPYRALAAVPFLRTHYCGLLIKPALPQGGLLTRRPIDFTT